MAGNTPQAGSVRNDRVAQAPPVHAAGQISFTWSHAKIRTAGFILLGVTIPATVAFAVSPPFVRWLCLAWLAGISALVHGLGRRAISDAVVVSVDQRGILDRRLMPRHIAWHEIAAICPVDAGRSHVIDIVLRWPKITLAQTRLPVRIGAHVQSGFGVPGVTISMLLLDGNVSELLEAVARYRPDLLHPTNRRASVAACR
jgi:hypothetical protein